MQHDTMTLRRISVSEIKINGGTQPRCEIDETLVSEYAEAMRGGAEFPAVVVFEDGVGFWLADGFHRTHAVRRAGIEEIAAEIHPGTKRDAVLYSVGANAAHGKRRTNADKRKAVMTLLRDEEWGQWSDREIARQCAVDHSWVSKIRRTELTVDKPQSDDAPPRTYTTKHGTTATMNTANIGRRESAQPDHDGDASSQLDEPTKPKSRGRGIQIAHEAIAVLKKIPYNDGLREDAFDTVINWINANRSRS